MKAWVARDKDGLWLFTQKPILDTYDRGDIPTYFWTSERDADLELPNSEFPEVTFENSPQEVEIKLKKKDYEHKTSN